MKSAYLVMSALLLERFVVVAWSNVECRSGRANHDHLFARKYTSTPSIRR